MAKRIQRSRAKGSKLPEGAVCVTRGTDWGNPFTVTKKMAPGSKIGWSSYFAVSTAEDAVACYREYLTHCPDLLARLSELRGRDLACRCPVDAEHCHADVLLALSNPDAEQDETL